MSTTSTRKQVVQNKQIEKPTISAKTLHDLAGAIVDHASTSSNRIFVYRFTESNIKDVNARINSAKVQLDSDTHIVWKRVDKQPIKGIAGRISSRRQVYASGEKRYSWAVRLEGENNPVQRTFRMKHTALQYARRVAKGIVGSKIIVID